MLEFKIIKILKTNTKILELIKGYTYQTQNGEIKTLLHTNLQFIKPIPNSKRHILQNIV